MGYDIVRTFDPARFFMKTDATAPVRGVLSVTRPIMPTGWGGGEDTEASQVLQQPKSERAATPTSGWAAGNGRTFSRRALPHVSLHDTQYAGGVLRRKLWHTPITNMNNGLVIISYHKPGKLTSARSIGMSTPNQFHVSHLAMDAAAKDLLPPVRILRPAESLPLSKIAWRTPPTGGTRANGVGTD